MENLVKIKIKTYNGNADVRFYNEDEYIDSKSIHYHNYVDSQENLDYNMDIIRGVILSHFDEIKEEGQILDDTLEDVLHTISIYISPMVD